MIKQITISLLWWCLLPSVLADVKDEVMTMRITDVATGLNNTEFVYTVIRVAEERIYLKKFVLDVDPEKVHHANVIGCVHSKPGTIM